MTAANAILYAFAVCAGGAILSLLVCKSKTLAGWVSFLATALAGAFALHAASVTLLQGPQAAQVVWDLPAYGSSLRISIDGLSAIFIGLIAVISILSAFYSIQYMDHYKDYGVGRYYPYFLLFIGGMYGIVSTSDLMVFFFIFWQVMTLASYALVRYENKKPENVRAAWKYLIMMEVACVVIMIAAKTLATDAGATATGLARYDFAAIAHGLMYAGGGAQVWGFLLLLVGFGILAGMWPFGQMWLPQADPACPAPVSVLLSGVMIKTGVYGLMRSFIWLIPLNSAHATSTMVWGTIITVLGTVTLFIGTMQALKQEQTKRLLAFHSIGQVGYILLGLGACLLLLPASDKNPLILGLATLGFYGALFHTVNHAMFKSLLFMNAGSILYKTGTQDLNKLGGLMKYMPLTAVLTLVASFSIAGVPLFNGFASKWTIYVSTLMGSSQLAGTEMANGAAILAICAVIAILTSALTLASFMKFFGVSFLSRTSTLVSERATVSRPVGDLEVNWTMRLPQVVLASCCLFFGLVPLAAYGVFHQALAHSEQGLSTLLAQLELPTIAGMTGAELADGQALFAPLILLATLIVLFVVAKIISGLGGAERRAAKPWLCGYAEEADCNRYTAHNLYGEVKKMFKWVGGVKAQPHEESTPVKK
jgi:formate hydrogenlyase subunit 3/multisubunit Na+/H+ antiporter MnhD subunit